MRRKTQFHQWVHEHPDRIFTMQREVQEFLPWLEEQRSERPLALEVGMGTGDFLVAKAAQEPDWFFLGLELKNDRVVKAYRKAQEKGLDNIAFLQTRAQNLPDYQLPAVDRLYVMFSDPWPKDRHAQRRLTAPSFLELYHKALKDDGLLIQKTDNGDLFDFSLQMFEDAGWRVQLVDRDFQTPEAEVSAYEKRFLEEGKRICYLEALKPL